MSSGSARGGGGGLGGLVAGVRSFFDGLRWVARNPKWWFIGLIPALLALVLYVFAFVVLTLQVGNLTEFFTPFADDWNEGLRTTFRFLVGVLIFGVGLLLAVKTYVSITLAIGEPFYEKLSEQVERDLGQLPEAPDVPIWRSIARSLKDSLVILLYVVALTIPLFVLGFVPVIGQTVVPVLGAMVSGFFLAVELTGLAMERRGLRRRDRFAVMRANMGAALGYGVVAFLIFLIPLAAVVTMPAAVAGAVFLVRSRLLPPSGDGHPAPGPLPPSRERG
ncbi:EI24 domain-containing protein [Thermopolyspora sp. NPDC052614]|uniref:EI24 domain-containing protein n=1 Tax=Thermopolyspora sp. NPDC052614 TaxID=3155682 RepID=UPI0034443513